MVDFPIDDPGKQNDVIGLKLLGFGSPELRSEASIAIHAN